MKKRMNYSPEFKAKIVMEFLSEKSTINTSIYRNPPKEKVIIELDLFIMNRIDELHTARPTWGYRMITKVIRRDDKICINRKKIRRMMRDMGVYTIYPKPNLSKRYHAQYVCPYFLRNLRRVQINMGIMP